MPQRIITGYVDTPGGRDALALGTALADLSPDTELTVTRAYLYNPPLELQPPQGWRKDLRDAADAELESARVLLDGRPRTSVTPCCGISPADALHRLADELHADAIVVGVSHERGTGRILYGSVSEQTLHGAPTAVAVAPVGYADGGPHTIRTIVTAHNGSPESERALEAAADLARATGAALRIVGVVDPNGAWYIAYLGPVAEQQLHDGVLEELRAAARRVGHGLGAVSVQLASGEPVRAITEAAAGADLLVLGSRGHGPFRRLLLGSVSSRLVRDPPCPILVLPRGSDADADADGPAGDVAGAAASSGGQAAVAR